jgi:catechol 2,3-dioxygenase-like lactoylglutathione lyase family enzyme
MIRAPLINRTRHLINGARPLISDIRLLNNGIRPLAYRLFVSVQIFCASLSLAAPQAAHSQSAGDGVGVAARIHFNTQTSDFERSREFYRRLGYTQGFGNFPMTNTHLMARSLGMYDLCTYELESIEVISIPGASGSTSIDLIKFAVPYSAAPPYALPNHLGMAYAALSTADFSGDYEILKQEGVSFLSAPFGEPGNRFVFMQDPEGVFLKLVEVSEEAPVTSSQTTTNSAKIDIQAMPYIGINVSDFDLALGFYRSLGYTISEMLPATGTLAEARAYGLDRAFEIRGADLSLAAGDGNMLRIVQWIEPFDSSPAYPAPINHIGINRIALAVSDLDAAVESLENQGVNFLSEIAPCCSGTGLDRTGIINAIDPDGVFVELVGPIRQRPPQPTAEVCSAATTAETAARFRSGFARLNL